MTATRDPDRLDVDETPAPDASPVPSLTRAPCGCRQLDTEGQGEGLVLHEAGTCAEWRQMVEEIAW